MGIHNKTSKDLIKRIKEEKVIFIDQNGIFHKIYNNDKDTIFYETPYHIPTNKPKFINTNLKYVDDTIMDQLKECWIPDISAIKDSDYTYWIETVYTHPCEENKLKYIQGLNFPALEFSVFDYSYAEKRRIIPCFDLTKVTLGEYELIKQYYKDRNKYDLYDKIVDLFMGRSPNKIQALQKLPFESKKNVVIEKINEDKQKTKVKKVDKLKNSDEFENQCFKIIDDIMSIAVPKLLEGSTLCFISLVKRCIEVSTLKEEVSNKLLDRMKDKLKKEYDVSIYSFDNESYLDETLNHFNLKRRLSIIDNTLAGKVLKYNYSLKN